jgi:hypothetical protein
MLNPNVTALWREFFLRRSQTEVSTRYRVVLTISMIVLMYYQTNSGTLSQVVPPLNPSIATVFFECFLQLHRLCGLVVRVLDYSSRGPGFDSRALQKKVVGLERVPLRLVSKTEELLDRRVAAPV